MFKDLILKNRSYRRFYNDYKVDRGTLMELVELARLSPSASNLQPLKYYISCDNVINEKIFSYLGWAGYLQDWPGPRKNERPSAYIIILGDKTINKNIDCDHGIAAQTMLLGAVEKGLGGCIIASVERDKLRKSLNIPIHLDILLTVVLGKPKEIVKIEALENDDVKYWRDAEGVHHVPKRALQEIII